MSKLSAAARQARMAAILDAHLAYRPVLPMAAAERSAWFLALIERAYEEGVSIGRLQKAAEIGSIKRAATR